MSLTAGTLSIVSAGATSVSLVSTAATGGTGPYTEQWYVDTSSSSFSPSGSNIISGATALSLVQSGLIPNTTYYFKVVYTDTGHSNDTVTSTALTVTTSFQSLSQNQFALLPYQGMVDLQMAVSTFSAQIASSQATALYPGMPVKVVSNTSGVPQVVGCTASSDEVWGFINYDVKTVQFLAGAMCEISRKGNIMYLWSTTAIARGAQVQLDVQNNGVSALVGSSGANIVGVAYDDFPSAGTLARVELSCPSFAFA